jgi:hypothetical protein
MPLICHADDDFPRQGPTVEEPIECLGLNVKAGDP